MAKNEELIQEILGQYRNRGAYVPKTAAENKARAEDEVRAYYDQLRLGAQQQQERADLALQQQRAGLQDTYDRQREASAQEYRQRYSQADRQMLSRGMQRSSYGAQVLANIGQRGAEAQQRLWDAQGAAEGNIDAQRAQLAQQLGLQLQQYDASRAADVQKRARELEDQEYERQVADQARRDQTGMQLANMLRQAERDQISDEQFEKQFGLSKQQFEAQLANQEWQRQYQEGRAKVSDEQWAKQFENQLANQQWQRDYQAARDAVSDSQWQQNYDFNAQKWADTLAEQLYQRQYQEARDAVKDDQWEKTYQLQAMQSGGSGSRVGSGSGSVVGGMSSSESAIAEALRNMSTAERAAFFQSQIRSETDKAIAAQAAKEQEAKAKAKAKAKANAPKGLTGPGQTSQALSTADIIRGLTPANSSGAANVRSVTPTTKVLQGPVNMDILNQMNAKSASTGIRFESELENALKNKKK